VRQIKPLPTPRAKIDTTNQSRRAQANPDLYEDSDQDAVEATLRQHNLEDPGRMIGGYPFSLHKLAQFAAHPGNLVRLLPSGVVGQIGSDAIRQWEDDESTRAAWCDMAEDALDEAAQEDDFETGDTGKNTPWANASNIRYPILSKATLDWNARAYPELVKGDQLVKPRTFDKIPDTQPAAAEPQAPPAPAAGPAAEPAPPASATEPAPSPAPATAAPSAPPESIKIDASVPAPGRAAAPNGLAPSPDEMGPDEMGEDERREARARRLCLYLNHVIFYEMDNWRGETDLLFAQMPVVGQGFKKVYMGASGVQSDFVSALDLCVDHKRTKSLSRVPRTSHAYEKYPYEIREMMNAGRWSDIDLNPIGSDQEAPRLLLEQVRMEDLDKDGTAEPYIVTVDIETRQVLCIEAAYTLDDVRIDMDAKTPRVLRFERWRLYADYKFLPDPRGNFYGMGFGRLLRSICDAVDTAINQQMDANSAAIAGGGFVGSGVRLGSSGQGGELYFRPGQYQTVAVPGQDIRAAIFEKTTPSLGPATFQLLELLLAAAKDLASVKDVLTGEGPQNAPVGTTLAIQQQALQGFTAVFARVYRGFDEEVRMIAECLKRWGRNQDKAKYADLTGGDFDQDFDGDFTDVQLVADPECVSRLMKVARVQALTALAESPVGQAAGMLQPGPARELVKEALEAMDIDRPERFLAMAPPNPEMMAKVADMQAAAKLKTAGALLGQQKAQKLMSEANLDRSKSLRELALAAQEGHKIQQEADRIMTTGLISPAPDTSEDNNGPSGTAPGAAGGDAGAGQPSAPALAPA
jgi:chaperonin GroES